MCTCKNGASFVEGSLVFLNIGKFEANSQIKSHFERRSFQLTLSIVFTLWICNF